MRPAAWRLTFCSVVYAVGLGLTFDEFGMWLHLGGLYWQRASYDAVITIAAVLGLIGYGSQLRRWRPRHYVTGVALIALLIVFGFLLASIHEMGARETRAETLSARRARSVMMNMDASRTYFENVAVGSAPSLGIYWRAVVPTAKFSVPLRTRRSALQKILRLAADRLFADWDKRSAMIHTKCVRLFRCDNRR